MALIIGYLISGIIFGCITKYIAGTKGYEGGFAWGFWLGIVGVLVVGFRPNQVQTEYRSRYGDEPLMKSTAGFASGSGYAPKENNWKCICGSSNSPRLDYCPICRRNREEAVVERKACPYCGAQNKKTNETCFACGKPMDGSAPALQVVVDAQTVSSPAPVISEVPTLSVPAPVSGDADFETLLHKLAKLHEQGILTDEEFTQKKAEILSRL